MYLHEDLRQIVLEKSIDYAVFVCRCTFWRPLYIRMMIRLDYQIIDITFLELTYSTHFSTWILLLACIVCHYEIYISVEYQWICNTHNKQGWQREYLQSDILRQAG